MTLRIGLLGASRIAPVAVIAPARADPRFTITAVAARDRGRAGAYAAEHAIAAVADDYRALVGRDDVDLVYNALPPAAHAEWTIAALKAGKAVLCEKPFARNAAEAEAMSQAARRAGRPLLEAFHYRFHNVMRAAVALAHVGVLGPISRAEAVFEVPIPRGEGELRWSAEQAGGALMDLGTYCVHALRLLIGEEPAARRASAVFEGGVDASLEGELQFPGGAQARLACSMTADAPRAILTVRGPAGSLEIVNFIAPQLGCRFTTTEGGVEHVHAVDGPSTYAAQLDHVADVLLGRAEPLTGGGDAIAQMRVIDALYRAAGRG